MAIFVACSDCIRDSHLPAGQSVLFLCIQSHFPSCQPLFPLHCCSQKQQSASSPFLLLSTSFKLSQATPASPPLHSCSGVPRSPHSYSYWSVPRDVSGRRPSRRLGGCPCLSLQRQRAAVKLPQTWVTGTLGAAKGNFWAGKATPVAISLPTSYSRVMGERGRDPGQTPVSCTGIHTPAAFLEGWPVFPLGAKLFVLPTLPPAGRSGPGARTACPISAFCLLQIPRVKDHSDIYSNALEVRGIKYPSPTCFDRAWVSAWMRGTMRSASSLLMLQIKNAHENTNSRAKEVSACKCHHRKDSTAPKEGHCAGVWTGVSLMPCMTHSWKWKCNPHYLCPLTGWSQPQQKEIAKN